MNRDSLFMIVRSDNVRIELMCGDSCNRNNIVYLPSGLIKENPTIEAGYEGEIPFGLPLASSFKFTLDTQIIDDEQSEIGKWIEENSSPTNKKPNVWIVREGNDIIFAGVQQADEVEEYDVIKAEAEIQCVGIFKTIMEAVRIDRIISAGPTDDDLYRGTIILMDFDNNQMHSFMPIRYGRLKFKKFYDFINACFGEIESKYHYFMRDYGSVCTWNWSEMPEVMKNDLSPEYVTPHIITHIFHDDDNALEPATGAIPELQNRYKQLWNFIDELLKGWSYYARIYYIGSNINFQISPVNMPLNIYSLNEEQTTSDIVKYKIKQLNIRVSNARMNKFRDDDLKTITNNINPTSLSGATTEATCVFGNEPNTVDKHYAGSPHEAVTDYSIKDGDKPPIFNFYTLKGYSIPHLRAGNNFKICGDFHSLYGYGVDLTVDGRDNYNREIRKYQVLGIAGVAQKVRDKYLSNSANQKTFTISVKKSEIQLKDLGSKYNLDIANIYNRTPFYRHVVLGSSAMLGKVVSRLNENYIECTFYYQGEN